MKPFSILLLRSTVFFCLALLAIVSCKKDDDDGLPITNDLRVLQVNTEGNAITSGATDLSVISAFELVFSHGLNTSAFEAALSITPDADYAIAYDATNSLVTISFNTPLAYETEYTIRLPQGAYGAGGAASTGDFVFTFTTAAFEPPGLSLQSDESGFFEGETLTVTAKLDRAILEEVSMELVFSGSAEGEGVDYSASAASITIPAGQTTGSIELTALPDGDLEGEETITIALTNIVNAVEVSAQMLTVTLGDTPPSLEIAGVLSLKIAGTSTNGRAIHLRALEDIADLSVYGIGIANNGGGTDGREIDLPAISVSTGEDILLLRDVDAAGLATYFGDCYAEFEHLAESDGVNFNGDDPFELYNGNIVIETYGDVEVSGGGLEWEYTGSWAYKLAGVWEYGKVDCAIDAATLQEADCVYPFCTPLQLQGILAILWDGSGTNGGKAVHLRANRDIDDLSIYSLGVANNGGGTDGIEYTFPVMAVAAGDHILLARETATLAGYFGSCFDQYDLVIESDAMNQNGDDAIELFDGMDVIETYGNADVDGSGELWDYTGSWAYKAGGVWTYGGVDCAATSTTTQGSPCPYTFCQ